MSVLAFRVCVSSLVSYVQIAMFRLRLLSLL